MNTLKLSRLSPSQSNLSILTGYKLLLSKLKNSKDSIFVKLVNLHLAILTENNPGFSAARRAIRKILNKVLLA